MSKGPQKVRGTQDMIGAEADRFHRVVDAFAQVRRLYAFQHIEMPVFEATEVFARSIGETTDIVSKEMYTFEDRGGESLTLRPEFTAGICRAFISDGWQQYVPLKIATWGAAFRYERPQKGRFRQFHQLDAEIIGAAEASADIELIAMADELLQRLGLAERVELRINTLGDQATRGAWRGALLDHFRSHEAALSEESRERLEKNPLRILDSKQHQDFPVVDSAPVIDDYLTAEAADTFGAVTAGLDAIGIRWTRDSRLVRGLDYYRHTTFEYVTKELGAQSQVIGGGRYDGLIEMMGGPSTPAVGWAAGIERLAMMIEEPAKALELAVFPDGDAHFRLAREVVRILADDGISAAIALSGSYDRRYKTAKRSGVIRALNVEQSSNPAALAAVRLRDLNVPSHPLEDSAPIRNRLRRALEKSFLVDQPDPDRGTFNLIAYR
jgi:histidyl-tRNA synthetase